MNQTIPFTNRDYTGIVARLTLGLTMFPHGAQKMLGLFGGYGFSGTMNFFTGVMHLPWIISLLVILIEFFGPIFLLVGFASRIVSLLMIALFIGMIVTSHFSNGFFMNWFGNQKGEGFEYHLLYIGLAVVMLINGSGKISIDEIVRKTFANNY
jgi:putative oxidoreductase